VFPPIANVHIDPFPPPFSTSPIAKIELQTPEPSSRHHAHLKVLYGNLNLSLRTSPAIRSTSLS
jgi:hypothetical protein